jgi:hypothetical protein
MISNPQLPVLFSEQIEQQNCFQNIFPAHNAYGIKKDFLGSGNTVFFPAALFLQIKP